MKDTSGLGLVYRAKKILPAMYGWYIMYAAPSSLYLSDGIALFLFVELEISPPVDVV
jgi:hypothetical protein